MDIREQAVQRMATASSYQRGVSYYRQRRVSLTKVEAESFSARVRGTRPYTVRVHLKGDDYLASCTCPYDWGGGKRHRYRQGHCRLHKSIKESSRLLRWKNFGQDPCSPLLGHPYHRRGGGGGNQERRLNQLQKRYQKEHQRRFLVR